MEYTESFLQSPLPETISELEAQMRAIALEQKRCSQEIRRLMAAEDVEHGIVFPQEIHVLHQRKNMLETHMQYRRVRVNRLNMWKGLK